MTSKDKTAAIAELQRLQLPTLPTVVIGKSTLSDLPKQLADFEDVNTWYLRAPDSVKGLLNRRALFSTSELREVLNFVFSKRPAIRVTITEYIKAVLSGVLLHAHTTIFVETVAGALEGLLVEGLQPSRHLFSAQGTSIRETGAECKGKYTWRSGLLAFAEDARTKVSLPAITEVVRLVRGTTDPRLFEWLIGEDGQPFFIDAKTPPNDFCISRSALHQAFDTNTFASLPTLPDKADGQVAIDGDLPAVLLESTRLHNFSWAISKGKAFYAFRGGILSHLSLYAAKRRIPTIISPSFKFSTKTI